METLRLEEAWERWHQEHDPVFRPQGPTSWAQTCSRMVNIGTQGVAVVVDWQDKVPALLSGATDELRSRLNDVARLGIFERKLLLIKEKLTELQRQYPTVTIIDSMAPEPFDVIRPFHITVSPYEDEYQASLLDANLYAYGDTKSEAIWNLKDIIVATFDSFSAHGKEKLGPGPARQFEILNSLIRKRL